MTQILSRFTISILALGITLSPAAFAEDASDGGTPAAPAAAPAPATSPLLAKPTKEKRWGIGFRGRYMTLPIKIQELFMGDVPGRAIQRGFGIDLIRRSGNLELILSFGRDRLNGKEGYYLELGADPTTLGKVDYVEFDNFRWWTADFSFIWHTNLSDMLALRYGAGLGVGKFWGAIVQTDAVCTGPNIQRECQLEPSAVPERADLPPAFPVVNVIMGFQFRPSKHFSINVDAGLHTTLYAGASTAIYF